MGFGLGPSKWSLNQKTERSLLIAQNEKVKTNNILGWNRKRIIQVKTNGPIANNLFQTMERAFACYYICIQSSIELIIEGLFWVNNLIKCLLISYYFRETCSEIRQHNELAFYFVPFFLLGTYVQVAQKQINLNTKSPVSFKPLFCLVDQLRISTFITDIILLLRIVLFSSTHLYDLPSNENNFSVQWCIMPLRNHSGHKYPS